MTVLLRKEWRLASDVAVGAIALLVASFPLALIGVAMQGVRPIPWISVFAAGCVLHQYTLVLVGALLGAVAFGREREDGNEGFLACLPIARQRQFNAKVAVAVGFWTAAWLLNGALFLSLLVVAGIGTDSLGPYIQRMTHTCVLSLATLGLSMWLARRIPSVMGAAMAALGLVAGIIALNAALARAKVFDTFYNEPYATAIFLSGLLGIASAWLRYALLPELKHDRRRATDRVYTAPRPLQRIHAPFLALLWKDARLQRAPLACGLVLLAVPFAAALANAFTSDAPAEAFRLAALIAMPLAWLVFPLWAASARAGEWAANTHLFVAPLPVSPRHIVSSKLVASAIPAIVVAGFAVTIFLFAQSQIPGEAILAPNLTWEAFTASNFLPGAVSYAAALPVPFAVAWYMAGRLRRVVLPTISGILTGPLAMALWVVAGDLLRDLSPFRASLAHTAILLGSSAALLAYSNSRHPT